MIHVKAKAPGLRPKTKPEDLEKIKEFYHFLDEHLAGVEEAMKEQGFEYLEIKIDGEQPKAEKALQIREDGVTVNYGLDEVSCEGDTDESTRSRICQQCGHTYTLEEAHSFFSEKFNADYTASGYDGTICGCCAAKDYAHRTGACICISCGMVFKKEWAEEYIDEHWVKGKYNQVCKRFGGDLCMSCVTSFLYSEDESKENSPTE